MGLDYFYGQEADQFAFYRIPKVLFTDERFRPLSAEAKLLYGLLLDRMALSQRNGWFDDQNRVYIIFTIEDGKAALGCAEQKIIKLLNELEKKGNLIERKRQGLGKPNLIYVKNFVESQIMNCENHNFGAVKTATQELPKSQCNNTDNINTDFSDTDPFLPSELPATHRMGADGNGDWQRYYVTNSGEGEGLLFYGNVILPFVDRFPTDLELYKIMTTKLSEVLDEQEE